MNTIKLSFEPGARKDLFCAYFEKNGFPDALKSDKDSVYIDTTSDNINIIAVFIQKNFKDETIRRILEKNFGYFTAVQQADILKTFNSLPQNTQYEIQLILAELENAFTETDELSFSGFVNFRLKAYGEYIENLIDSAVQKFIAQKEFAEFTAMLKFFVSVAECKISYIAILPQDDIYKLLDEKYIDITQRCLLEFMSEGSRSAIINFDDLVLSTLINNSPKKIVIYNPDKFTNRELYDTILNVFEGRVTCADFPDGYDFAENNVVEINAPQ